MVLITEHEPSPLPQQTAYRGLTSAQAAEQAARGLINRYTPRVGRSYWTIVRDNVLNIFNLILFVLLAIVFLSQEYLTVLFAGFSVVGNALIGTAQEINAKQKLHRLSRLAARDLRVWRDDRLIRLPASEVVVGDVIPIQPGDRLLVDGLVLRSDALEMDESHLTGESDPVYKEVDAPLVSGSFCLAGAGLMVTTRVGRESTLNRLASAAAAYKNPLTPTQRRIATLAQITLLVMLILAPMLVVAGGRGGVSSLEIVKNLVVFVTSLVPQGLILVATISLTIGAFKIGRHQTLIQRINAVESLANVTVLCFDKTGTLTRNRLSLVEVIPVGGADAAQVERQLLAYVASLASRNSTATALYDDLSRRLGRADLPVKKREIAFNSVRKWGAVVFDHETLILGAPERVLGETVEARRIHDYSAQGMRVLAFARARSDRGGSALPEADPLALIVMRDELRADIHTTLAAFRAQGVKLKVISGDNAETVRAVAASAGLIPPGSKARCRTGTELDALTDLELEAAVYDTDIFARIEPETKQRIVKALRRRGEYVAMVGDGVNDVPALKEADLAIAMNDGAQIAKDVSDIVLLNNALSTLPRAFREGGQITQTLFGVTKMYLARNGYNTLLFIFATLMLLPFPITPIQISWVAFGTLNFPATLMTIGVLRPEPIKRFRRDVLDFIVTAGIVGGVGMSAAYLLIYETTATLAESRAAITLMISLYGVLVVWHVHGIDLFRPRSFRRSPRAALISPALTSTVLLVATGFGDTFEFAWPPDQAVAIVIGITLMCAAVLSVGMRRRGFLHRVWGLLER
jgi:cation-transporting ATPase E